MTDLLEHLTTTLSGAYTVEHELSGGGMSRVFVAEETALGRRVVVKVLPPEFGAQVSSDRFRREVQVVARLQHPHIVPLLSAGEAAGVLYYTMPLIEGESLRMRLARTGALPVGEAARIMREVSDAVACAHASGVIHRDLTPGNILLAGHHALVTDFGVAKALTEATGGTLPLTSAGMALGTPAYMAPEQVAADPTADHRADVYALGVVAYEMLAGRPPFTASTTQAVLAAHATKLPEPISAVRPAVPAPLAALVMRCLEKLPADRPQSAEAVRVELESMPSASMPPITSGGSADTASGATLGVGMDLATRSRSASVASTAAATEVSARDLRAGWAGQGPITGRRVAWALVVLSALLTVVVVSRRYVQQHLRESPSVTDLPRETQRVAVAPFENRTGDPSLDALGAMAADWITQGLAETGLVDVFDARLAAGAIGPTTASGTPEDRAGLAARTGAALVVGGRIYRRGDSLTFSADITDGRTQQIVRSVAPVTADARTRTPGLEPLRQRVIASLATIVDPALSSWAQTASQPPSYAAYDAFMQGFRRWQEGQWREALPHLTKAAGLDTTFTLPLVLEAMIFRLVDECPHVDSINRLLAPRLDRLAPFDRLMLKRTVLRCRGDLEGAYLAMRELARLTPRSELSAYQLAAAASWANHPRETVAIYTRLDVTRGALSGITGYVIGFYCGALHRVGEYDRELEVGRLARQRRPNEKAGLYGEIEALAALGRLNELAELLAAPDRTGPEMAAAASELEVHGHASAAPALWQRVVAWYRQQPAEEQARPGARVNLALALDALGQLAEAHALLERVVAENARNPRNFLSQALLGMVAAHQGHREEAERIASELAANHEPHGQPPVSYARAVVAAALGKRDEAVRLLRQALGEGLANQGLEEDRELASLRAYPPFTALSAPKE
ncbi:MAG: serine/threonine-protein kinase [Gemmatimonadota bacterium]|nr:serine/threonine-protein kinase [Gemmatimonadota bacterium]